MHEERNRFANLFAVVFLFAGTHTTKHSRYLATAKMWNNPLVWSNFVLVVAFFQLLYYKLSLKLYVPWFLLLMVALVCLFSIWYHWLQCEHHRCSGNPSRRPEERGWLLLLAGRCDVAGVLILLIILLFMIVSTHQIAFWILVFAIPLIPFWWASVSDLWEVYVHNHPVWHLLEGLILIYFFYVTIYVMRLKFMVY